MGRFSVDVTVTNHKDTLLAEAGVIPRASVRTARISGVVDTGATRLVLPEDAVTRLGLPIVGKVWCRFADGRRGERPVAGEAQVEIQGRTDVFSAVVEPGRSDALVGAFILEELDFVVDHTSQRLVPRDPKGIFAEIEALSA